MPEHSHPTARQDDGEGLEGVSPFPSRLRVTGLAAAVLGTVVVAAQLIELFINRVLRPDLEEWTWISEVLVLAALLVLTALWARLRLARTAIADLERERLTIHAELAVAAALPRCHVGVIRQHHRDRILSACRLGREACSTCNAGSGRRGGGYARPCD